MWSVLIAVHRELILFAAFGFVIGGLDDLLMDFIWIVRTTWRRLTVYRRHPRADALTVTAKHPGRIAIFVPAWREDGVIGPMLGYAKRAWAGSADYRIYVGVYPNDPATQNAVRPLVEDDLRMVVCPNPGPTTKADCLNALWRALCEDERREGRAKAIVLHDAEDIVHSCELRVFDALIERVALVQLPVLPLIDKESRWIGGHYNDEFAESHGKTIVVREAIGAAVPSAGVGSAFSRCMLGAIADARGGAPFDQDSLTEDYELGLRIGERGGRCAFVRLAGGRGGVVAVRAHFPATLATAIRQKSRWIAGIALSGWDRLGWAGGWAESWMRFHDRRALLGAIVLVVAYLALVMTIVLVVASIVFEQPPLPEPAPVIRVLFAVTGVMLFWRLAVRCFFVTRAYGWREGLRSIPRVLIGNVVAIIAARQALWLYLRMRRDGQVRWDKTTHAFPSHIPAE